MSTPVAPDDVIVWISGFGENELSFFKSIGIDVLSLKNEVANLHNWFLNNPFHCNSKVNKIYAEKIYKSFFSDNQYFQTLKPISMIECNNIPLTIDNDAIINSAQMEEYTKFLQKYKINNSAKVKGCVVINANPCTIGHIHLIKEALKEVDFLYIFLVQESSLGFSYLDRENMLKINLEGIDNVSVLPGGDVFTSAISFPEYFNRSSQKINPLINHKIFCKKIAPILGISVRFFGEETEDNVTHILNLTAKEYLPKYGIRVKIIPRLKYCNVPISAKSVRKYLKNLDIENLSHLVTPSTLEYLLNLA